MSRSKEIVVAHYREDLSWTSSLPDDIKIIIYNKHEGENLLPNVGREAHSFLTHIIRNYDCLADFTVFLQGYPLDHCANLIKFLKNIDKIITDDCIVMIGDGSITCDVNGRPHCGKLHMPVGKLYSWALNEDPPNIFVSAPGAQFGASRDRILSRPVSVYEKLLASVSYANNPIELHCLERMWPALFGLKLDLQNMHKSLDYSKDEDIDASYLEDNVDSDSNLKLLGELREENYIYDQSKITEKECEIGYFC